MNQDDKDFVALGLDLVHAVYRGALQEARSLPMNFLPSSVERQVAEEALTLTKAIVGSVQSASHEDYARVLVPVLTGMLIAVAKLAQVQGTAERG